MHSISDQRIFMTVNVSMLAAFVLFFTPSTVSAADPTIDTVRIQANRMVAPTQSDSRQRQTISFFDDVVLKSGTLTINSNKFSVLKNHSKIILLHATGDVRLHDVVATAAQGRQSKQTSDLRAQADAMRYFVLRSEIILTGNAMVEWQGSVVKGDEIRFDMKKREITSVAKQESAPTEIILDIEQSGIRATQAASQIVR